VIQWRRNCHHSCCLDLARRLDISCNTSMLAIEHSQPLMHQRCKTRWRTRHSPSAIAFFLSSMQPHLAMPTSVSTSLRC
jgi:hypothetical protein